MAFCTNCGRQIDDKAVICVNCGCQVKGGNDSSNFGIALLSFFIPLVGLILWAIWKDEYPLKAKSAGKGALIGVIVGIVCGVIYGVCYGIILASLLNKIY